jgi:peptidoglycan/LPS O-acetylase OafA/YrhL
MAQPLALLDDARVTAAAPRPAPPPVAGAMRLQSLDGLRGIAAFVVLVYHTMLVGPAFAAAAFGDPVSLDAVVAVLSYTPLHILWAGNEAVTVFFALSGYVLVRPYLHAERSAPRGRYLVRRCIRLYGPVIGSVAFSALCLAIPRMDMPGASRWIRWHVGPTTVNDALFDAAAILGKQRGHLNTALWSMRLEIIFSLLLPVVVLGARRVRGGGLLLIVLSIAASVATTDVHGGLVPWPGAGIYHFLFKFGIGVGLAMIEAQRDRPAWAPRGLASALLYVLACCTIVAHWPLTYLAAVHGWSPRGAGVAGNAASLAGVAGLLALACSERPARALTSPLARWLGSRSFSLYLVHEPVVVTMAFALSLSSLPLWFVPLAVVTSLAVAEAFYRLIEQPTLRLADRWR